MEKIKEELKDRVVAELRRKGIKLWLPPYHSPIGGGRNAAALRRLAEEYTLNRQDCLSDTAEDVFCALAALQDHALAKLAKRKSDATTAAKVGSIGFLEVRILGSNIGLLGRDDWSPEGWAERVEIVGPQVLVLHRVSPKLSLQQFFSDLEAGFGTSHIRLVYGGRSLMVNGEESLLRALSLIGSASGGGTGSTRYPKRAMMLCIASTEPSPFGELSASVSKAKSRVSSSSHLVGQDALITSIRCAAGRIQSVSGFDITDQRGRLVSMSPEDRLAFLTALGLHRLGRNRMDGRGADGPEAGEKVSVGEVKQNNTSYTTESAFALALPFLLEADKEWDRLPDWRDRVDNYGLLQLDIAWTYLRLEILSSLPDCARRLSMAERVLRKQVDANFVTLALVQAEMGNPVPPLTAIFVRLFLLQGVAYRYSSETTVASRESTCNGADRATDMRAKSRERLDWAKALCHALRAVVPQDLVKLLREATGVSEHAAVSALRRANGVPDRAAQLIAVDREEAAAEARRRATQSEMGLCRNGRDYVDLDLIPQLRSVLGLELPQSSSSSREFSDEGLGAEARLRSGFGSGRRVLGGGRDVLAVGLLRLSDNDLVKAIEIYQDAERNQERVLDQVSVLDHELGGQNVARAGTRKRNREKNEVEHTEGLSVDEVALATLVSMGVEKSSGQKALRKTENNVELALLSLSQSDSSIGATDAKRLFETKALTSLYDSVAKTKTEIVTTEEGEADDKGRDDEEEDAMELLKFELGKALQDSDMEEEILGNHLDEEWFYIEKFCFK